METNVIDAPVFVYLKYLLPISDIGWRITGQWKIAAVMCAAEINTTTIELKLLADCLDLAEAECDVSRIPVQYQSQFLQLGMELIPKFRIRKRDFHLGGSAVGTPCHRKVFSVGVQSSCSGFICGIPDLYFDRSGQSTTLPTGRVSACGTSYLWE